MQSGLSHTAVVVFVVIVVDPPRRPRNKTGARMVALAAVLSHPLIIRKQDKNGNHWFHATIFLNPIVQEKQKLSKPQLHDTCNISTIKMTVF